MSTVQLARTAEKLRTLADESDDVEVRRGAVLGLGLVGDRKDVAFLARVLVRADRGVSLDSGPRGAAVAALGLIRDGGSLDRVEPLLGHADPVVRALAIAALGSIADKDETPALTKLFERSNFVREFPALRVAMRTL
jgi:HEAT repeat protein